MQWYAGSITEAIEEWKKAPSLFVVFVESDDAQGNEMAALWAGADAATLEAAPTMVAITLMADSVGAKQFAAIYPTPVIPCSYVIDNNARPLEIFTMLKPLAQERFNEILCKAFNTFRSGLVPTPASDVPVNVAAVPVPESTPLTTQAASSTATHVVPASETPAPQPSSSTMDIQEKIKRAKELLEKKRAEEAAAKAAEDKKKEVERRESAKMMLTAQEERRQKEMIEAAAQRRREKAETEIQKQRLLEQIKKDREDNKAKRERDARREAGIKDPEDAKKDDSSPHKQPFVASDRCRVQLRFPDGSTALHDFPSSDTLGTLRQLVSSDPRVANSTFRLAVTMPRRVYADAEYDSSFVDLGLTPASNLLVLVDPPTSYLPASAASVVTSPAVAAGGFLRMLSLLLWTPIQMLLTFIGYGTPAVQNAPKAQPATQPPSGAGDAARQTGPGQTARGARRSGAPGGGGSEIRQRGNIRTLHNDEHDDVAEGDDDEANWNGNSTQFL